MKKLVTLVLVVASVGVWAGPKPSRGKPKPPSPPPASFMDAANWTFYFGNYMPTHPANLSGQTGWRFDMPVLEGAVSDCWELLYSCPQVDYVLAPYTASITGKSYLTMTIRVVVTSGNPVFNYQTELGNTCVYPAHVRAVVWSCAESCGKQLIGVDPYGRWWSNPVAVELNAATGLATVNVPIDPSQWSSVYGEVGNASPSALAGWLATMGAPGKVGMTFGGGCYFGHGVNVSGGTAQFELLDYSFH